MMGRGMNAEECRIVDSKSNRLWQIAHVMDANQDTSRVMIVAIATRIYIVSITSSASRARPRTELDAKLHKAERRGRSRTVDLRFGSRLSKKDLLCSVFVEANVIFSVFPDSMCELQ